jgi:hypothetical protein
MAWRDLCVEGLLFLPLIATGRHCNSGVTNFFLLEKRG